MKTLLAIFALLPHILAAVKTVEDVAGSGNGPGKKALVVETAVKAAAAVGAQVPNQTVQAISATVDAAVDQFNSAGIFKTGAPPAPATAAAAVAR